MLLSSLYTYICTVGGSALHVCMYVCKKKKKKREKGGREMVSYGRHSFPLLLHPCNYHHQSMSIVEDLLLLLGWWCIVCISTYSTLSFFPPFEPFSKGCPVEHNRTQCCLSSRVIE
ncbi:hypothetical protein IWX46DRAFT_315668 [Phyllosticta citricarpa]|uniref:Uncharacterized protein n=1 Tax=Phyllosticta citricarpa TaxID=55181 RepID=A0ABR1LGV5_9PEZI